MTDMNRMTSQATVGPLYVRRHKNEARSPMPMNIPSARPLTVGDVLKWWACTHEYTIEPDWLAAEIQRVHLHGAIKPTAAPTLRSQNLPSSLPLHLLSRVKCPNCSSQGASCINRARPAPLSGTTPKPPTFSRICPRCNGSNESCATCGGTGYA